MWGFNAGRAKSGHPWLVGQRQMLMRKTSKRSMDVVGVDMELYAIVAAPLQLRYVRVGYVASTSRIVSVNLDQVRFNFSMNP